MEGIYSLDFGGQTVGRVEVTKEGLYYRFRCSCRITGDVVCKAVVVWGNVRESLGILVPTGTEFTLDRRMPVRHFPEGVPKFSVMPSRPDGKEQFIPIRPEEPFDYIEKLKHAYLVRQNGILGIVIRESAEI